MKRLIAASSLEAATGDTRIELFQPRMGMDQPSMFKPQRLLRFSPQKIGKRIGGHNFEQNEIIPPARTRLPMPWF